jgi:uncharacterized repeat protein (TIGR03803 family)
MENQDLRSRVNRTVAIVGLILFCASASSAATEKILHNFSVLPHGANPESNLIADALGNLYGTTYYGGGYGVVFELTPASGGKWTETILYTFVGNPTSGPDGAYPAAGLTFDPSGNLYGTTSQGGIYGQGTVFKLTPTSGSRWKETVIHQFAGYPGDGANPLASMIFDAAGNLYGTTSAGGSAGGCGDQYNMASCGTVFELSPAGDGWTETLLHNFQGGTDGCFPAAGLIFDQSGSLYGTSEYGIGGGYDCFLGFGTVFKLSPGSGGIWSESVLYRFMGNGDGGNPAAALIFDSAGNLYGTGGSPYDAPGSVFELSPGSGGKWTEKVLYNLDGPSNASLIFDKVGNLYGTIEYGGSSACSLGCGSIFELSPGSNGWTENILYAFTGGSDGAHPQASLLADSTGSLYTTVSGGANSGCGGNTRGCGAAVKLTPSTGGKWTLGALYDFPSPHDGSSSQANLISDAAGNLYGTTTYGGTGQCSLGPNGGCGTVFELSPTADGKWKERVLYNFTNSNGDGANPIAGLVFDSTGNLYGTTQYGGNGNYGTVFRLSPNLKGRWTETVIYAFSGNEGFGPAAGLTFDKEGRLYGTTELGGSGSGGDVFQLVPQRDGGWLENILYIFNQGYPRGGLVLDKEENLYGTTLDTVFKLSHNSGGWAETVLHTFSGNDGLYLKATVVFDKEGSLYGTTVQGGIYDAGVVFELTPGSGGVWTEAVLYNFVGVDGDGALPASDLIFDNLGNLYGTTTVGGINGGGCGGLGCGIAFELTPLSNGQWKERVLHRFTGGVDGGQPDAGFTLDSAGNLYSTTSSGGAADQGAVFEIKP